MIETDYGYCVALYLYSDDILKAANSQPLRLCSDFSFLYRNMMIDAVCHIDQMYFLVVKKP